MFIEVTDFVGFYTVAKNQYNVDEIQSFINEFERSALSKLLGAELSQILIDDAGSGTEPTDEDLLKIFNPFDIDRCGRILHSGGIKKYLLGIVYYEFVTTNRLQPSINGGASKRKVEAGQIENNRAEIFRRYNTSVDTGRAIQEYIELNLDIYPTFNGQRLLYNY